MEDIRLTKNERGYTIYQGDRYTDGLCWGEMLEQLISLTHGDILEPRYRFITDEEWIATARRSLANMRMREE